MYMYYAQKLGESLLFDDESDAIAFVAGNKEVETFQDSSDVLLVREADWEDEEGTLGRVTRLQEMDDFNKQNVKFYVTPDGSTRRRFEDAVVAASGPGVFRAFRRGHEILVIRPYHGKFAPVVGAISEITKAL